MTELVIMRGLPASGKGEYATAWVAEAPNERARISRDDLRQGLFSMEKGLSGDQEVAISTLMESNARTLLRRGVSVVVDATNLRLRDARAWADLAEAEGVAWRVEDVLTDVDTCVTRDINRWLVGGRLVGEDVIRNFDMRYKRPWPTVKATKRVPDDAPAKYVPNETLRAAIIVDLDGTLARNVTGRPFYGPGFEKRVYEDDVVDLVQNYVSFMWGTGIDIIFMSGRNDRARDETVRWLHDKAGWHSSSYELFMRADKDSRADFEVKRDLFDEHVRKHYNVLMALDDRDQVVNLWRSMGIPCWQVASGAF